MKYLVQFSGGVGSFAAAYICVEKYGLENVGLLFCDTKTEDEDLYRFVNDCLDYFNGIDFVSIEDGRNVWQVFSDVRFIGNSRRDPCSKLLKRDLARKYIESNCQGQTLVFGIDWMESHRVSSIQNNWYPFRCLFPLCEDKNYDKNKFMTFMESELGIKRPRLYSMGFSHNNCGGFCVKAGKASFLNLLDKMPDRYMYHENKEIEVQKEIGKPYTILRERKIFNDITEAKNYFDSHDNCIAFWWCDQDKKFKSVTKFSHIRKYSKRFQIERHLSLKELRLRAEEIRLTEEGQLDLGGCGCFV